MSLIDDVSVIQPVINSLDRLHRLDITARSALNNMILRVSRVSAGQHLFREGARLETCCMLIEGYACRHKLTSSGDRQIVSFHIPGDLLDVQHLELERADHNLQAITVSTVAWVSKLDLQRLVEEHISIRKAVLRQALIEASIFREWVLNVGRRESVARVAHLLCEFAARHQAGGLGSLDRFELPMSQEHIADATGITPVHVNRMLQALGARGVIARNKRDVEVLDWERLRRIADFDPAYLHLVAYQPTSSTIASQYTAEA